MDFFYQILLFFTSTHFFLILSLLGYHFYSKTKFSYTLIITLFSIVTNLYFKSIFKIPLDEVATGHAGWAYPSGHTQFAVVFWVITLMQIPNIAIFIAALLTLPLGFTAMIHYNYHTFPDILGGICAGALVCLPFYYIFKIKHLRPYKLALFTSFISLLILTFALPKYTFHFDWGWQAFAVQLSMAICFYIQDKNEKINIKFNYKISSIILSIASVILLNKYFFQSKDTYIDDVLLGIIIGIILTSMWMLFEPTKSRKTSRLRRK
jgi:hypothetical protein